MCTCKSFQYGACLRLLAPILRINQTKPTSGTGSSCSTQILIGLVMSKSNLFFYHRSKSSLRRQSTHISVSGERMRPFHQALAAAIGHIRLKLTQTQPAASWNTGNGHGFQPLSLDEETGGRCFDDSIFGWPKKELTNSEAQLWVVEQVSPYRTCDFEDSLGFLHRSFHIGKYMNNHIPDDQNSQEMRVFVG